MSGAPLLSIVVPMYNESNGIDHFFERVCPILESISPDWEIVCINDGSKDDTVERLKAKHVAEKRIKVIDLARNFGKELALTAGIFQASGQAIIPIDADMQDPPELIPEMVEKWREGYKVVLATRTTRPGDNWLKRTTAIGFYRLINMVSNISIPKNTGDFRLMDRQVVEAVKGLGERTRFMKGIFAWVGFKTHTIYFERKERFAGRTSYNYRKMWQFALDGIFSFTTAPLKIWTYIGGVIAFAAFLTAVILIIRTLVLGVDVPGYASLMVVVLFMGGMQMLSLGIIGEYVGRIYRETKQRPLYVINELIGFK